MHANINTRLNAMRKEQNGTLQAKMNKKDTSNIMSPCLSGFNGNLYDAAYSKINFLQSNNHILKHAGQGNSSSSPLPER